MDITKSSSLSILLYSAILVALFWWGSSIGGAVQPLNLEDFGVEMWSITKVLGFDSFKISSLFYSIVGALLTFLVSLQVARMAIKGVIYMERTYMPSLVFVLLGSAYSMVEATLPTLVSLVLLVGSFTTLLRSYLIKHVITKEVLTASVYFGLAVLIAPQTLYLLPLLFLYLAIFRLFDLREWITALVGVFLPAGLLFLSIWVFWGERLSSSFDMLCNSLALNDRSMEVLYRLDISIVNYIFIAVTLVLFLLSVVRFLGTRKMYKSRGAKGLTFFIYFALWVLVVMLVSPVRSLYMMPFLALPLSVVIPSYYAANRAGLLSTILYILFLVIGICSHLVGWIDIPGVS